MIIDGKGIAEGVYRALEERRTASPGVVTLGIVVGSHDPVIESFVRIKSKAAARLGFQLLRIDLPVKPTTADALSAIEKLAPKVQGLIVQLPLPEPIDTERVLAAIPPYLDVDGINPTIVEDARAVRAPVAGAIREILQSTNSDVHGKTCVIVGAGRLVGAPAAHLMKTLGASVSTVTLETGSLDELKKADIAILGAGTPGLVKPEMLKPHVILIDAGTSEQSGRVAGDADPACADVASVFTPVPGGVGPVAVAMIFKNLLDLAKK
jgi:methylenetetrahydrofolate dehydrogenase (NADP+)/methenyltetrahydrofolate cyclohydrolase